MVSSPLSVYPYPTGEGFDRFSSKGMCPIKPYKDFFDGLCSKFKESGFNTNYIQCGLVILMYFSGNKGKFWKILLSAAISGFCGTLIEGGTTAYVCREADINTPRPHLASYLFAEIFWIIKEYSIPILNLYKMKTFSNGNIVKYVKNSIIGLFFLYSGCRFYIGYERMIKGLLTTPQTKYGHMASFAVLAISDLLCSISIFYYVYKRNRKLPEDSKLNKVDYYIKRSNYIIIIFVDFISILVSIFNGITEAFHSIPSSYINPFQCIKTCFILILACDSLLFKYNIDILTYSKNDNYDDNKFEESKIRTNIKSTNIFNDNIGSVESVDYISVDITQT